MSRSVSSNLNKTSQAKVKKLRKQIEFTTFIDDKDRFVNIFSDILKSELKSQKGCSERAVTDYYLDSVYELLDTVTEIDPDFFDKVKIKARAKLAHYYTDNKTYDNNIDIYFNDVKREYIKSPMSDSDNLEFLPENRETFIKNNLKLVINCAKRYQNLGLPFEDLIQTGNYGLCVAFDKYNTDKANLKSTVINKIKESELDSFTYKDAEEISKYTNPKLSFLSPTKYIQTKSKPSSTHWNTFYFFSIKNMSSTTRHFLINYYFTINLIIFI